LPRPGSPGEAVPGAPSGRLSTEGSRTWDILSDLAERAQTHEAMRALTVVPHYFGDAIRHSHLERALAEVSESRDVAAPP